MTGFGIGGWRRGALLVAACVAGGGTAAAIASVPDSNGTIHACVDMTRDASGQTVPSTTAPNVVIIDPSAGQHCIPPDNPVPNQSSISWNMTGPQGATGASGAPGAPGAPGGTGAAGPATTVAAGRTLTLAGGQVITVGGGPTLTVLTPPVRPNAHPVATLTIGDGPDALNSAVLNTSFTATGGAGAGGSSASRVKVHDITIVKHIDKSSPKLYSACVTGKHFPKATLVFRKASGKIYLVFRFKLVAVKTIAFAPSGGAIPEESITLDYATQQIASS